MLPSKTSNTLPSQQKLGTNIRIGLGWFQVVFFLILMSNLFHLLQAGCSTIFPQVFFLKLPTTSGSYLDESKKIQLYVHVSKKYRWDRPLDPIYGSTKVFFFFMTIEIGKDLTYSNRILKGGGGDSPNLP